MSCALVLGSAKNMPFAANKTIGIVMHQKTSALASGLFNNVLGIAPGTTGKEILENGKKQLGETYPHITQIEKEKETAKAKFKAILDSHQKFEKLQQGHKDLIPKLKEEHAEEVTRLNAELKKTIELNNKYLEIKSETIFGKRLLFQISNQFDANKKADNHSTPKSKDTTNEKQEKFDDPYEEIIMNELGGIKIN